MARGPETEYYWVWNDKPRVRRWVRHFKKWESKHRRTVWTMMVPIMALLWTTRNADPFTVPGQQETGYVDRPRRLTQLSLANECRDHTLEVFVNHVKADVLEPTWEVSGMFSLQPGETLEAVQVAHPEVWFHARARKEASPRTVPVHWEGYHENDCDSVQPTHVISSLGKHPLPSPAADGSSKEPSRLCGWLSRDIGIEKTFTMPFHCDPPIVDTDPTDESGSAITKISLKNECPGQTLEVFANYVRPNDPSMSRVLAGMFLLQPGETIYAVDVADPSVYFHVSARSRRDPDQPAQHLPGDVDGCDSFEYYEVTSAESRRVLLYPRRTGNLCDWSLRDTGDMGGNATIGFRCPSLKVPRVAAAAPPLAPANEIIS